jgi:MAE_28990/MAE_18760-like HEPN
MFSQHVNTLKSEIATIVACARLNSEFRALRHDASSVGHLLQGCPFTQIAIPDRSDWIVHDHCAGVTRLYAVYEQFVADLVSAWLTVVPAFFADYAKLPDVLRKHHRLGVARILPKVGGGRYKHLTIPDVIGGLFRGTKFGHDYQFLYEQFALTERNLRLDALSDLLAHVGVEDLKGWLARHPGLQSFMSRTYGGQETVDSKLNDLVSYRNEAAHGERIGQVLGLSEFLNLAEFIAELCNSLSECVFHHVCRCQLSNATATLLGKVTEVFEQPQAVVALLSRCKVQVDQELVAFSTNCCKKLQVISVQLNGVAARQLEIVTPTEVGMKFNGLPNKGADLIAMQPRADVFTALDI